jgi:hypothetical protein
MNVAKGSRVPKALFVCVKLPSRTAGAMRNGSKKQHMLENKVLGPKKFAVPRRFSWA